MTENLTQATLCVVVNNSTNEILLGMKNKYKFGGGNYNGPGGKVKEGEEIEQTALREFEEESGLKAILEDLDKVGEFTFYFPPEQEKFNQVVHVYKVSNWHGDLKDSDEMIWKWFPLAEIPYNQMWDDDQHWLPLVLAGKRLKGTFYFNKERKIEKKEMIEVDSL